MSDWMNAGDQPCAKNLPDGRHSPTPGKRHCHHCNWMYCRFCDADIRPRPVK